MSATTFPQGTVLVALRDARLGATLLRTGDRWWVYNSRLHQQRTGTAELRRGRALHPLTLAEVHALFRVAQERGEG